MNERAGLGSIALISMLLALWIPALTQSQTLPDRPEILRGVWLGSPFVRAPGAEPVKACGHVFVH